LTESLLADFDTIDDYSLSEDAILFAGITPDNISVSAGTVDELTEADINTVLNGLLANTADAFDFEGDIYIALNDGVADYQASSDAIILLDGIAPEALGVDSAINIINAPIPPIDPPIVTLPTPPTKPPIV
jgi:hypothetical protein